MHKDLTATGYGQINAAITALVQILHEDGQSLGIAREAALEAFDREAETLDA